MLGLRNLLTRENQNVFWICLAITFIQAPAQGLGASPIIGTWDAIMIVEGEWSQKGQTPPNTYANILTLEFLSNNMVNVYKSNDCPDEFYQLPYSFQNDLLTIDGIASGMDGCEGELPEDCSYQFEATLNPTGDLTGSIAYQCTEVDEFGNALSDETDAVGNFFAERRREAGASENGIIGAWDVAFETTTTASINGDPLPSTLVTLHGVWLFGADGIMTRVTLDSCVNASCSFGDGSFISSPYSFDTNTGALIIDDLDNCLGIGSCSVESDLSITGDTLSGTIDVVFDPVFVGDIIIDRVDIIDITGTRRLPREEQREGGANIFLCAAVGGANGGIGGDVMVLLIVLGLTIYWHHISRSRYTRS